MRSRRPGSEGSPELQFCKEPYQNPQGGRPYSMTDNWRARAGRAAARACERLGRRLRRARQGLQADRERIGQALEAMRPRQASRPDRERWEQPQRDRGNELLPSFPSRGRGRNAAHAQLVRPAVYGDFHRTTTALAASVLPAPIGGIHLQSIEWVVRKPNRHPSLRGYGMSVSVQLVDPLDPSSHRKDTVPAVGEANVRLDVQRSPSS